MTHVWWAGLIFTAFNIATSDAKRCSFERTILKEIHVTWYIFFQKISDKHVLFQSVFRVVVSATDTRFSKIVLFSKIVSNKCTTILPSLPAKMYQLHLLTTGFVLGSWIDFDVRLSSICSRENVWILSFGEVTEIVSACQLYGNVYAWNVVHFRYFRNLTSLRFWTARYGHYRTRARPL